MNQEKAIELALKGLRLLRQQSAAVLEVGLGTSDEEVLDAIAWFEKQKRKPVVSALSPEEATVYGMFSKAVREQIQSTAEWLVNGKAVDFAEYKNKCGQIAGWRGALMRYEELLGDDDEGDDD